MKYVVVAGALVLAGCQAVVAFEQPRESEAQCADGLDNDGNGAVDCIDGGCAGVNNCRGCGDGALVMYEECDDGNLDPNDGCNEGCRIEICGDGVTNPGEQCDDANDIETDGCRSNCMMATCGDGIVRDSVEQCDDGGLVPGDGCTAACVVERCGDSITHAGPDIIGYEFVFLASSCNTSPPTIEFFMNGDSIGFAPTDASCSCAPASGFQTGGGEGQRPLNGLNMFTVDYAGQDNFLAWAVVRLFSQTGTQEIVLYEGVPGAAAARATSMCSGGFIENAMVSVSRAVRANEDCDDGNTNDQDGCTQRCEAFNP